MGVRKPDDYPEGSCQPYLQAKGYRRIEPDHRKSATAKWPIYALGGPAHHSQQLSTSPVPTSSMGRPAAWRPAMVDWAAVPCPAPAGAIEEIKPGIQVGVVWRAIEIAHRCTAIFRVVIVPGRTLIHAGGGMHCAGAGVDRITPATAGVIPNVEINIGFPSLPLRTVVTSGTPAPG